MRNRRGRAAQPVDDAMFSFAETAKTKFENGFLEDKRRILSCLGSNLLLTNGKLSISLDFGLGLFLEVVPKFNEEQARLEPHQSLINTVLEADEKGDCPDWLESRDSNPD